MATYVEGF